jgi:DNA-binding NtrC family response regulator
MNAESDRRVPWGAGEPDLAELERRARAARANGELPLREWLALAEAWRITQALRACRGNRSAAARVLGIGRRTLYAKMEKLGIVPSWEVRADDHSDAA